MVVSYTIAGPCSCCSSQPLVCSAGAAHSAFIKTDGTLWTMGRNFSGQLCQGDTTDRLSYTQVGSATDWVFVSCGDNFTLAIKSDGTMWSCGNNLGGALCLGDTTDRHSLVKIGTDTDWAFVSCNGGGGPFGGISFNGHVLAIKTGGTLWSCGANLNGELGLGDTTNRSSLTQIGSGTNWHIAAAGHRHSNAIKTDGTLWAWGYNFTNGSVTGGVLGLGNSISPQKNPVQVGSSTDWAFVSSGTDYSIAIKSGGTMWSCGFNTTGQLGLGNTTTIGVYTQVGSDADWAESSCGNNFSLAVKTGGGLWAFGDNSFGQLGDGSTTERDSPVSIDSSVAMCSGANAHSLYVTIANALWGMGDNTYGDLGDGTTTQRNSPINIV